jgi:lysylphosphatidylglycerol synthetase-like protein (DUF2156 family)
MSAMNSTVRLVIASGIVCLASWLALAAGAGNVGLQRSISKGAISLLEQPLAIVLVAVVAFVAGAVLTRAFHLRPVPLLLGVLVGDLVAGVVLAPIAVGELEPIHAALVFAAVTVLGVQPTATLAGAWLVTQVELDQPPSSLPREGCSSRHRCMPSASAGDRLPCVCSRRRPQPAEVPRLREPVD